MGIGESFANVNFAMLMFFYKTKKKNKKTKTHLADEYFTAHHKHTYKLN